MVKHNWVRKSQNLIWRSSKLALTAINPVPLAWLDETDPTLSLNFSSCSERRSDFRDQSVLTAGYCINYVLLIVCVPRPTASGHLLKLSPGV